VRPGKAAGVRRWAEACVPTPEGDRLTLRYADTDFFAGWLVGYGADVLVLDPPPLRDEVVKRLKEIVAAADPATDRTEVAV
jgi:proteasome accessory factor B